MRPIKSLILLLFLNINLTIWAQFTDEVNTNRPGNSLGAFAVGKTILQLESGINYLKESHTGYNTTTTGFLMDLNGRYGVWKEQLEVALDIRFQKDHYTSQTINESRNGLKQTSLGVKYLFHDPYKNKNEKPNIYSWKANHKFKWKSLIPAISGYAGVNYTMKNDYYTTELEGFSPKVILITQNHFSKKLALVTNLIANKIGKPDFNYGGIATITYGLNEKWSTLLEARLIKNDLYDDPTFTTGATYLIKSNLQIDFSITKNVENYPSSFSAGIGMAWRFDKKHNIKAIEDGKETKQKENTKREKQKNGVLSEEELDKAAKKAEKNKNKEKNNLPDQPQPLTQEKKKRMDDLETGN